MASQAPIITSRKEGEVHDAITSYEVRAVSLGSAGGQAVFPGATRGLSALVQRGSAPMSDARGCPATRPAIYCQPDAGAGASSAPGGPSAARRAAARRPPQLAPTTAPGAAPARAPCLPLPCRPAPATRRTTPPTAAMWNPARRTTR